MAGKQTARKNAFYKNIGTLYEIELIWNIIAQRCMTVHVRNIWYILIFFPDATQQNAAIKNGTCYKIHKFIWDNMSLSNDFKDLNKNILFDSGTIPKEEKEIDKIVSDAIKRTESLIKEQSQTNPEICSICNHHFGGHQLAGLPDEQTDYNLPGCTACPGVIGNSRQPPCKPARPIGRDAQLKEDAIPAFWAFPLFP